jgi:hypothetical protein
MLEEALEVYFRSLLFSVFVLSLRFSRMPISNFEDSSVIIYSSVVFSSSFVTFLLQRRLII